MKERKAGVIVSRHLRRSVKEPRARRQATCGSRVQLPVQRCGGVARCYARLVPSEACEPRQNSLINKLSAPRKYLSQKWWAFDFQKSQQFDDWQVAAIKGSNPVNYLAAAIHVAPPNPATCPTTSNHQLLIQPTALRLMRGMA